MKDYPPLTKQEAICKNIKNAKNGIHIVLDTLTIYENAIPIEIANSVRYKLTQTNSLVSSALVTVDQEK